MSYAVYLHQYLDVLVYMQYYLAAKSFLLVHLTLQEQYKARQTSNNTKTTQVLSDVIV